VSEGLLPISSRSFQDLEITHGFALVLPDRSPIQVLDTLSQVTAEELLVVERDFGGLSDEQRNLP
jgi:hypothetical protein